MSHRVAVLLASFACTAVLVGVAAPAAAHPKSGTIEFESLDGELTDHDQFRIDYALEGESWSYLAQLGVEPQMVFYREGHHGEGLQFVYSFPVGSRAGSYTLPGDIGIQDDDIVEVGLVGYAEGWRIESLKHGDHQGARIAFRRHDDHFDVRGRSDANCPAGELASQGPEAPEGGHEHDDHDEGGSDDWEHAHEDHEEHHGDHHEEDEAESSHQSDLGDFEGGEEQQADESHDDDESDSEEVAGTSAWRASVVKACKKHAEYDSDVPDCVEQAKRIDPQWAAESVVACGQSVEYESELVDCLEIAAKHDRYSPAASVRACAEAAEYESEVLDCLESTVQYQTDPAPIVRACGQAVEYESDVQDCVELGQQLEQGGADVVSACSGRDWDECIERAID